MSLQALLEGDLESGGKAASDLLPDVRAALDALVPALDVRPNLSSLRRFCAQVDIAIEAMSASLRETSQLADLQSAAVASAILRRSKPFTYMMAPTPDGFGALTVLVDRLRGYTQGQPHACTVQRPILTDAAVLGLFKMFEIIEFERQQSEPLRRAMRIFDLSRQELAQAIGVSRQAVEKWLLSSVPAERLSKVGAVAQIADTLHYWLRPGLPAAVVRRPAEAYGGRSMLEVIAADEHEWLLDVTRNSFDFNSVA